MNCNFKLFRNKAACYSIIAICVVCLAFKLQAASPIKPQKPDATPPQGNSPGKTYRIQFFSLKRQNSIAPATITLLDKGKAEITLEHEEIITTKCDYSIENFSFEANWEFAIKKNKTYAYGAHFEGLYFQDSYIIGVLMLEEYIEPRILTQKIPFLFWGSFSAQQQIKKDEKK
jgi:hypothetical protein